jgi:cyanate permease
MNGFKTTGQWFPPSQLGLANGLISMGMALGFLLGAFFSATTLSPLLGGWRNVFLLYGLIGALFSIPWALTRSLPAHHPSAGQTLSMRRVIPHVARLRDVWLLGLVLFGVGGAIQGMLGYLPLYLLDKGWDAANASGALSAFHTSSMIFVLPFALWSDRLGSRKRLLLIVSALMAVGVGVLSFANGGLVWAAVLTAGFVRDAFMAIFLTMVIETEGVGPMYAGTATGFIMTISSLGNVLAPPLGNSLSVYWAGAPFVFWTLLIVLGMVSLFFVKGRTRTEKETVNLESVLIQG